MFFIQILFSDPLLYLVAFAALAFGLVLHNIFQSLVAARLGDTTALRAGFISTDPRPHIDQIYLIFLAFFGWAIPNAVPLRGGMMRGRAQSEVLAILAGPLGMALYAIVIFVLGVKLQLLLGDNLPGIGSGLQLAAFKTLSSAIAFLVPLPPMDGARIAAAVGTPSMRQLLRQIDNYGPIGFFIIMMVLSGFFTAVAAAVLNFVGRVLGL